MKVEFIPAPDQPDRVTGQQILQPDVSGGNAGEDMAIRTFTATRQVDVEPVGKNHREKRHHLGVRQVTEAGQPRMSIALGMPLAPQDGERMGCEIGEEFGQ